MNLRHVASRVLKGDPARRPQRCYGQNGEDLVLDRLMEHQRSGFYVDVGAHHPMRFSNTYLFYRRGWRGINIDAEPGSMAAFARFRPRDTNIECGIASKPGELTYFRFNDFALNTFDPEEAALKEGGPYRIDARIPIRMRRLDEVLEANLPVNMAIDFLSVDVEGLEIEVFESNDWSRFRPRFILAETLRTPILELGTAEAVKWLEAKGYRPITQAFNTTIFEDVTRPVQA